MAPGLPHRLPKKTPGPQWSPRASPSPQQLRRPRFVLRSPVQRPTATRRQWWRPLRPWRTGRCPRWCSAVASPCSSIDRSPSSLHSLGCGPESRSAPSTPCQRARVGSSVHRQNSSSTSTEQPFDHTPSPDPSPLMAPMPTSSPPERSRRQRRINESTNWSSRTLCGASRRCVSPSLQRRSPH